MHIKRIFLLLFLSAILVSCDETAQQSSSNASTESTSEADMPSKKTVKPIYLTDAEFCSKVMNYRTSKQWKYLGDKPAIVDFYATWCGPCKRIAPILDELANKYGESIYIYKVDVDKEGRLAQAFNIQSIPTLLFIPMNDEPQIVQGALSKQELESGIKQILNK